MTRACDDCLTRARLLEALAPRIALVADRKAAPVRGLLALSSTDVLDATRVPVAERAPLIETATALAREDAGRVIDGGAVCLHKDDYPPHLRNLPDPPHALFHTGPLDRLLRLTREKPVAIVGARKASEQGKSAACDLGRGLAIAGITVISGMAFGVDAACHRGALDAGGGTVAVLASGADRASPVSNRALYRELRAAGSVISEMPWGASAWPWLFPARNRIMAALAELTVVVEAAAQSGSLITARFAEDLGRPVGAMPGAPGARMTAGNNELLYDGASVIRDARDAVEVLYGASAAAELATSGARAPAGEEPDLRAVLDAVEVGASFEAMAAATGLGARELRAALSRLERRGLVKRVGLGSYVARAAL